MLLNELYELECRLFRKINQHFERRIWNAYFRTVTNVGGAVLEILLVLLLLIFARGHLRLTAVACAISLTASHIIVQVFKKCFPRKRPYLILDDANYPVNALQDNSFPSGHTTAIFSVIIPLILFHPSLSLILLPVGLSVAVSRIFLGLHYPSDVLAGMMLGTITGYICFIKIVLPYAF
ncbi:phosphatase PAP2 family protein [Sporolactobacillus sp. CPB3-1]|uniref:Phosphatase PAP2 family protein n=1 Tax=Sporolactobacillus mangiferae TaxID=2940498 RepID=A0ABT0M6S0_9BACL|nr:phosphatase PAP2 family protein [Sporolactobacillus mangiferae]MCL1630343.1 phosphatase PAP2 family protein [Sporolactobacillus mangiferae]